MQVNNSSSVPRSAQMLETLYNLLEQLLRDVPNAQPSKMDHYTRTMAQLNRYLDKLENEIEEEECPEIEWLLSSPYLPPSLMDGTLHPALSTKRKTSRDPIHVLSLRCMLP